MSASAFPEIDATKQDVITDEQAKFFRENGLLKIKHLLRGEELKALQDETYPLYKRAVDEKPKDPDYMYARHEITGDQVPFRIEFVIDKTRAGKALLGHPFILKSIEKLQGKNFVPTWDSMVFKKEGAGKAIPWHRDAAPYTQAGIDNDVAAINVDFYLDGSDMTNCLWGILGSNRWSPAKIEATLKELNKNADKGSFLTPPNAVPIPVEPGDVLFHSILVLHGSPAAQSKLRRVIYYEFRPGEVEKTFGPHMPEYIPHKQKLLLACLRERAKQSYGKVEKPFAYSASGDFAPPALAADEQLSTYRYPHEKWWRK
jgi:ectoine hydroxylase-related dioxygenase (phytanoyl-CoA dioxygenase family)